MSNWYYVVDGRQAGPVGEQQLREMLTAGQIPLTALVWREGMPNWVPAGSVPGMIPGAPPLPPAAQDSGNRIAAGVCGILLGSLGVHKFILGLTTPGLVMLLVTLLTCGFGAIVMHVIGLVEGIIYLTKSDAEFHQRYMVEKRGWF